MQPTLEDKIDKIFGDVAYMRGKWDEAIPALQNTVKDQGKDISDLKTAQANTAGKSGIIGAIGGSIVSAFFLWIFKR